jgi:hypothetical protein
MPEDIIERVHKLTTASPKKAYEDKNGNVLED